MAVPFAGLLGDFREQVRKVALENKSMFSIIIINSHHNYYYVTLFMSLLP